MSLQPLLLWLPLSYLGWAVAAPPNILFILADDLGRGDVGVYPNPTKRRRPATPTLDLLASEGITFLDAYAGYSVCAPSRTTLMTGYHSGHFSPNNGGTSLLKKDTVTVASMLRKAGYTTALMGKWGLDGNFKEPRPPSDGFPTMHGFDWFYGQSDQWQCHDYYPPFMYNNTQNLTVSANVGANPNSCGNDFEQCAWAANLWTTDAVDYIENAGGVRRPKDKPFFLYLAYTSPHAGSVGGVAENDIPAPGLSKSSYANETSWPKVERNFANTVTSLDAAVGRVLHALKDAGEESNTVVFFSSDNGAHQEGGHKYQFFNSSGYLNGYKRSIHDGGHRAPLLVRWPGKTPAGAFSRQQWCFYDFLPTAADIAGVPLGSVPPNLDGYSFMPTLLGKVQEQPAFIYTDFAGCNDPVVHAAGYKCSFSQNLRMGNWSGVCVGSKTPCTGEDGHIFLYDMSQDEAQLHDISAQHPDVVQTILKIMAEQYDPTRMSQGKPVPVEDLSGKWKQQSPGNPAMRIDISGNRATLTCVEPCTCCNWRNGSFNVSLDDVTKSVKLVGDAMGPKGFTAHEVGSAFMSNGVPTISWQGDRNWASWVKMEAAETLV